MIIVFDLDGTLIDSSERMYRLFQRLIPESKLSKDEYWELKRNSINHQMILEKYFPSYDYDEFNAKWLDMIERDELLCLDKNYTDTLDILTNIKQRYDLFLLTARQSKDNLMRELKRLELFDFFNQILTTEAKSSKESLLVNSGLLGKGKDWFVSDMGKDIIVGTKCGFKTIGITHGFMCEEKLKDYNPSFLIKELYQLMDIV